MDTLITKAEEAINNRDYTSAINIMLQLDVTSVQRVVAYATTRFNLFPFVFAIRQNQNPAIQGIFQLFPSAVQWIADGIAIRFISTTYQMPLKLGKATDTDGDHGVYGSSGGDDGSGRFHFIANFNSDGTFCTITDQKYFAVLKYSKDTQYEDLRIVFATNNNENTDRFHWNLWSSDGSSFHFYNLGYQSGVFLNAHPDLDGDRNVWGNPQNSQDNGDSFGIQRV